MPQRPARIEDDPFALAREAISEPTLWQAESKLEQRDVAAGLVETSSFQNATDELGLAAVSRIMRTARSLSSGG